MLAEYERVAKGILCDMKYIHLWLNFYAPNSPKLSGVDVLSMLLPRCLSKILHSICLLSFFGFLILSPMRAVYLVYLLSLCKEIVGANCQVFCFCSPLDPLRLLALTLSGFIMRAASYDRDALAQARART